MKTGALIDLPSADSMCRIAANEAIVPVEKLYEICAQARELLVGKYGVGRVIARPFVGRLLRQLHPHPAPPRLQPGAAA